MNRAIIMGRLGADPESRKVKGGIVATMSIATSEKHTGRDRNQHETTEWHRVVVFGKFAEACMKYLGKGSQVLVEGKIQTRSWEDDRGVKKYVTEINASRVIFIGKNEPEHVDVPY